MTIKMRIEALPNDEQLWRVDAFGIGFGHPFNVLDLKVLVAENQRLRDEVAGYKEMADDMTAVSFRDKPSAVSMPHVGGRWCVAGNCLGTCGEDHPVYNTALEAYAALKEPVSDICEEDK